MVLIQTRCIADRVINNKHIRAIVEYTSGNKTSDTPVKNSGKLHQKLPLYHAHNNKLWARFQVECAKSVVY